MLNARNLLVLVGEPMQLQTALTETRGMPRGPRRFWRQLRVQFRNQRAATIGPDLSHRRTIVAEVLRTSRCGKQCAPKGRPRAITRREALQIARDYAYEIAANYSHAFVVFMSGRLGRLWNRLYDGVEMANLSSLKSVDEGSEIVYVPCHRSHMDYLLLSYVVYRKGFAVPHFGKVYVSFGEPLPLDTVLRDHVPGWDPQQPVTEDKPAWLTPLCRDLAHRIMTRINAAACVTPINLVGMVLLATPRQCMGEGDLVRQLELYASLLRQAPYSPRIWVTPLDGQSMLRHGEALRMLRRQAHPLGDIVRMTESEAVLASYYRNNVLHLLLLPSLLACAFLNNATVARLDLLRLAGRVYPYVADEYFLRWTEEEIPAVVDELLEDLLNHGLLLASDDRSEWRRPPAESSEAVQLSVLARITVPILERYYLSISLLLRAGSGKLTKDALELQCQQTAQRMAMLYELNSPEFFDRALFGNFIERLRSREVIAIAADEKISFEAVVLGAVAADAQYVLHEQIRNSILQVVHR